MLNKFTVLLLLAGLTAFYACKDKLVDNPLANKPPTTKVFLNPDSVVSQQQSRIHLYWSGDDPDGTVIGFYFSKDDSTWTFTTKNDSLFSLLLGATDKIYTFRVAAVDNSGNGQYDSDVHQKDINNKDVHFGPEPFTDLNGNGKWDSGEPFVDIGLIDPNPASINLPIKNTSPTIAWDALSTHPDISFPAMTFGWYASDIDGNNTIQKINIALNDTNNFVSIDGTVSLVTIRTTDFNSSNPKMDIYINGDPTSPPINTLTGDTIKLPGLKYNANNIFYVQAVDISDAKSPWISSATQANSNPGWFVQKPKANIVLINDYAGFDNPGTFYPDMLDSIDVNFRSDVYDLVHQKPPYINFTFLETIKLFKGAIWYTDNNPSLDLASATVPRITAAGVKILFSMIFPQNIDEVIDQIQGFLPVQASPISFLGSIAPNKIISAVIGIDTLKYPTLKVTTSFNRVRAFQLNPGVTPLYYFPNKELTGYIGFENSSKNLFFIGAPLHKMNGIKGNVVTLLKQVLINDFSLTP
jgi:hypothetical protein